MHKTQIEKNLDELVNNFNKENFIYDLLVAYGISKTSITRLKKGDFNLSKVEGEVLYKKKVLFKEVESDILLTTIDDITKNEEELKHNPRFVIVTDFKTLLAKDTKTGLTLDTPILEINKKYDFFLPWAGQEKYLAKNENEADRKASYRMAKLYDILVHENPEIYADGGHNLNIFLSRLLFCFFAEDTAIFQEESIFTNTVKQHTNDNGSDVNIFLDRLFKVLNTEDNSDEPDYLKAFPYVNGDLFRNTIVSPKFNKEARKILLECGELRWNEINPDIFGSMIQAVVNPAYRSGLGMHYTSVPNIMKVIEPLFLNDLKAEFEKNRGNIKKLRQLIFRLSNIKIFDPACGSGNFLIIAYKELRALEIEIIKEINKPQNEIIVDGSQSKIHFTKEGHRLISNASQSRINFGGKQTEIWFTEIQLSQFYGIELDDFAHEMAILSLWLAEHQMNKSFINELHDYGRSKPILPLKEAGHITQGNATRLDWKTVCPANEKDEVYILGNPPYLGQRNQKDEHKKDLDFVFCNELNYKNLDYISIWFYKASKYIKGLNSFFAFVTTNSITQGVQVEMLWPKIFKFNVEIFFGYKDIKWTNNAKGNAGVTVCIVGVSNNNFNKEKLLFTNNIRQKGDKISPYLKFGNQLMISKKQISISGLPKIEGGNQPREGGFLILNNEEKNKIINSNSNSEKFIKKLIGSNEFLNDIERWCIWVDKENLEEARLITDFKERFEKVRSLRENGNTLEKNFVNFNYRFVQNNLPKDSQIIIPVVSSENRDYIPIGFLDNNIVVLNSANVIFDSEPFVFGIVSSKIHNVWVKAVAGKLENRIRYTTGVCYNSFPFPLISEKQKEIINLHVFEVLDERAKHPEKTIAQLYDPFKMPRGLKEAHHQLDLAVERCYRLRPFESDAERLEYLFKMYEEMTSVNKIDFEEKNNKKAK